MKFLKKINIAITLLSIILFVSCKIEAEKNYVTVSFNTNGGAEVARQIIIKGTTAIAPVPPTKESTMTTAYTFDDWYIDKALTKRFNFATAITKDITLYAKWLEEAITYTVTFNTNGGSPVESLCIENGKTIIEPNSPTKISTTTKSYIFDGWYIDEALTEVFDFSTAITKDITLYAKWLEKAITYTVTFNTNGGSPIESLCVENGKTIIKPSNPSKNGYAFIGWYQDCSLTKPFDFTKTITSDTTLYALWFVSVTGGTVRGVVSDSQIFVVGHVATIPDLYVCDHEVTQIEYETYCKYGASIPSINYGKGDNYPAYYVSWYDAIVYCNLRSIAENLPPVYSISNETEPNNWPGIICNKGKFCGPSSTDTTWDSVIVDTSANGYRLPTEDEWEYIARSRNTCYYIYSGSDTIDDVAWYDGNSNSTTHEVMKKAPNNLGIYDMSGNVWEWCFDWYSSSEIPIEPNTYHVPRGGSRGGDENDCTVFRRNYSSPRFRGHSGGFRVVRNANSQLIE